MLTTTSNQMSEKGYTFINLEYMEMMADGDAEMKQVMLNMLLTELPEELEKMLGLLASENWEELGSVSHKMKSTLAFVGNPQMTNANKDIETLAKTSEGTAQISGLMKVMEEVCPKILEELKMEQSKLA